MIKKQLVLPYRLSPELLDDFKAYLPYCAEGISDFDIQQCGENLNINYVCEQDVPSVETLIRKLADTLRGAAQPDAVEKKVIFDNPAVRQNQREIYNDLLADGHLIKFGEGQYGMGKTFLTVFKYFERGCYRLALQQNPEEYVYPIMIPMDYLKQCDYATARSITFFSGPDSKLPIQHAGKTAVCLHCYPHFENKVVTQPVSITTQGRCYRYEPRDMKTMENLWEFIMRECIYLGSAPFVRERLAEIRRLTENWMIRLGIRCRTETADDPFFADDPAVLAKTRLVKDSKYELRISIPNASLAAASFNFHGPHFSKAFNITDGKNYVATGCAGFGIERLTYAFLSHYGLQTDRWPRPIQDEVLA